MNQVGESWVQILLSLCFLLLAMAMLIVCLDYLDLKIAFLMLEINFFLICTRVGRGGGNVLWLWCEDSGVVIVVWW